MQSAHKNPLSRSVVRKSSAKSKQLERIIKGFANHRRIEILELLARSPERSLGEVSVSLQIELKTASEHLRRLAFSGLILKRHEGREVRHKLTERGDIILAFLRGLR